MSLVDTSVCRSRVFRPRAFPEGSVRLGKREVGTVKPLPPICKRTETYRTPTHLLIPYQYRQLAKGRKNEPLFSLADVIDVVNAIREQLAVEAQAELENQMAMRIQALQTEYQESLAAIEAAKPVDVPYIG